MPDDIGHEITGDKNMPTIKEIAAFAGVSRGTVDRVLNNRGGVSQKTADKIRRIMEEQNFQPNLAGMALATTVSNFCALLIAVSAIIYKGSTFSLKPIMPKVPVLKEMFVYGAPNAVSFGCRNILIILLHSTGTSYFKFQSKVWHQGYPCSQVSFRAKRTGMT